MKLENLTAKERQELLAQLKKEERDARELREKEVDTYKKMTCEMVIDSFGHLSDLSTAIEATKDKVRANFATIIAMKNELYGVKEGQQSHQFMSDDGLIRIRIGYNVIDNYDDTVEVGIEKVKEFIGSLASDDKSQMLVDTIMKLLSKDSKGTLKASRVLQLQQMADRSDSDTFKEGVQIIKEAYTPLESKSFIRADWREKNGAWQNLPLSITEA